MYSESIQDIYQPHHKNALSSENQHPVSSGFPSPADNYTEQTLDLNQQLIRHPSSSFLMRVQGDSMDNAGIHDGDLLVVDRAIQPEPGKVVIAAINGDLTVKRLTLYQGQFWLTPENPRYRPVPLNEFNDSFVWGVVVHVIHSL
ncbi:LexA family protein [Oceanospirillum sediminis]|uniref:Translesion error-prone DNA polymerase V autoproteolytic subunit n=1 Tax=Oceanospirillum sediminis TaxID=2760088 RepID=A0A839INM1_9GAMM|nr:translesion error-prone DNA polymerase V autoproteolytic subunit [Oceanospirillum sediminis]MBB1486099.1 translesion error-prone DNA polymerase V autoproteolytic subunit [Oceanospirillum sediminis]